MINDPVYKPRVLLVDDNRDYAQSLQNRAYSYYKVELIHYDNWEDAQSELTENSNKYLAIILDGKGKINSDDKDEDSRHLMTAIRWLDKNTPSMRYYILTAFSEEFKNYLPPDTKLFSKSEGEDSLMETICRDLRETGKFKVGQNYPVAMRLIDEHFSNQQCKDFVSIYLNVIEASSFGVNGELGILRVLCERAMEVLGERVLNFRDGEEFFNEVKSFYPDAKKGKRLIHFMDYYDERMEKIPSWVK